MRRRSFIASAAVLLAGCSGDGNGTVNEEPSGTIVSYQFEETRNTGIEEIDRHIEEEYKAVIAEFTVEQGEVESGVTWVDIKLETEEYECGELGKGSCYHSSNSDTDELPNGWDHDYSRELQEGETIQMLFMIYREVEEYWLVAFDGDENVPIDSVEDSDIQWEG